MLSLPPSLFPSFPLFLSLTHQPLPSLPPSLLLPYLSKLGPVRSMCLVLLTVKAGFAVTDAATNLKLIEYGMPKEEIALMSPLLILTGSLRLPDSPSF